MGNRSGTTIKLIRKLKSLVLIKLEIQRNIDIKKIEFHT